MSQDTRSYIAIDLKSFYASVECVDRGLDPLTTNLLVADLSRTDKTICLAVSPSLKAYGVGGRARLFEVMQRLREVNYKRLVLSPSMRLTGKSVFDAELKQHHDWEVDYIAAPPRMARYIDVSSQIYSIYLNYVAPEDMHVYSVDEVFIDVTAYLSTCRQTAHEFAKTIIKDVLRQTGITATAGIGTNMYLCKVAMDIVAKHIPADEDGVRIASLDEMSYRRLLWEHEPITDFWRVGRGISRCLSLHGMRTMGDVARCSIDCESILYKLFGKNAELLIDHAWGWEPCTMADVKSYRPRTHSLSHGQVLHNPYIFDKALIVTKEMADSASLELVEKGLKTNQIVLVVGYDRESLSDPEISGRYTGDVVLDFYGRAVPKHSQGTVSFDRHVSSSQLILDSVAALFREITNPLLLIRRITIAFNNVITDREAQKENDEPKQLDLFTDYDSLREAEQRQKNAEGKERRMQEALIKIKKKYGKNVILRGHSYVEGATAKDRNEQIGGHKA